jgi:hypothetical protein
MSSIILYFNYDMNTLLNNNNIKKNENYFFVLEFTIVCYELFKSLNVQISLAFILHTGTSHLRREI